MSRDMQIIGFTEAIWEWYGIHKRKLPWRDMPIQDDTQRSYRVMVSEIMLQQTQVNRVIIVFRNFLERFPSLKDLAGASNAEVIMAWRGMGYNSRALRLRDAAKTVMTDYKGVFPHDYDQLLSMKGIGPYTAAAIRNFAFNLPTPCIDTNIRRILHRTFVGPEGVDGTWQINDRELLKVASDVLKIALTSYEDGLLRAARKDSKLEARSSQLDRSAANWHAALMDYGSLIQTKISPKWDECILTARKIMLTTPDNWVSPVRVAAKEKLKKEPGRMVGSTYIPNRIFRGKIVEALRDAQNGLSKEEIGHQICIDWNAELRPWLNQLIKKLVTEKMLRENVDRYQLYV